MKLIVQADEIQCGKHFESLAAKLPFWQLGRIGGKDETFEKELNVADTND
jgi:hypothetical protein